MAMHHRATILFVLVFCILHISGHDQSLFHSNPIVESLLTVPQAKVSIHLSSLNEAELEHTKTFPISHDSLFFDCILEANKLAQSNTFSVPKISRNSRLTKLSPTDMDHLTRIFSIMDGSCKYQLVFFSN